MWQPLYGRANRWEQAGAKARPEPGAAQARAATAEPANGMLTIATPEGTLGQAFPERVGAER